MEQPGTVFARSFLERNHEEAGSVFSEVGSFFMSTPGMRFEGTGPEEIAEVLGRLLRKEDDIKILSIEEKDMGKRRHLLMVFTRTLAGTVYTCEQHAYYELDEDGTIFSMRILCSGFLQLPDAS